MASREKVIGANPTACWCALLCLFLVYTLLITSIFWLREANNAFMPSLLQISEGRPGPGPLPNFVVRTWVTCFVERVILLVVWTKFTLVENVLMCWYSTGNYSARVFYKRLSGQYPRHLYQKPEIGGLVLTQNIVEF